jgi:hypothetical protein
MTDKPKRPRDANQLAHMIAGVAIGEVAPDKEKDPSAVERGLKGGSKGGKARASRMTPEERSESARKAARARWCQ